MTYVQHLLYCIACSEQRYSSNMVFKLSSFSTVQVEYWESFLMTILVCDWLTCVVDCHCLKTTLFSKMSYQNYYFVNFVEYGLSYSMLYGAFSFIFFYFFKWWLTVTLQVQAGAFLAWIAFMFTSENLFSL